MPVPAAPRTAHWSAASAVHRGARRADPTAAARPCWGRACNAAEASGDPSAARSAASRAPRWDVVRWAPGLEGHFHNLRAGRAVVALEDDAHDIFHRHDVMTPSLDREPPISSHAEGGAYRGGLCA